MTSPPKQGGPSRRRSSGNARSPVPGNAPNPVQLTVPAPRWSLTSRIKERDIWGLGLSSDLPVDESALFAPKPPSHGRTGEATGTIGKRMGAIRLSSDTDLRAPTGPSSSSAPVHPLQGKMSPLMDDGRANGNGNGHGVTEVLGDVSRPALRRLTSDMERNLGEGLSRRGSASESRKGKEKAEIEVEVLIHQVMPNETVAGIALLYGIDLSTLRKANKLWPSDPAHLRKHLYVPLEACRWDRAKGSGGISLVRGPGEGQVTLVEKGAYIAAAGTTEAIAGPTSNGEGVLVDVASGEPNTGPEEGVSATGGDAWRTPIPEPSPIQWTGWDGGSSDMTEPSSSGQGSSATASLSPSALDDPWAASNSSNSSTAASGVSSWPGKEDQRLYRIDDSAADKVKPPPGSRILDVVRIPASQLRFFPANKPQQGSSRTSFDSSGTTSRASLQMTRPDVPPVPILDTNGPSIVNDMNFPNASHSGTAPKERSKSTMVRLRPPTSGELPPTSFANRLSNFFAIPPPPPGMGSGAPPAPSAFARNSRRSARHASMDASNALGPGGRMSLDSARSAYSALSGKSGGSGRSAGGSMSRSGSLRALGLSSLEGLGAGKEGEERKNDVEMQRRGSEDTLRPQEAAGAGGSGPVRVGSLRRGKKLD